MEHRGDTYISVNYKKEEYKFLELSPYSKNIDSWQRAIDIFEDRIEGRYLKVLSNLMDQNNLMRDGFVIMAVNCLLLETLLQFKMGWDETPSGQNKSSYKIFLKEAFPTVFKTNKSAEKFYTDIRCGILHSAQTKKKSKLTFDKNYVIDLVNYEGEDYIYVDVYYMTQAIEKYYLNYVRNLKVENHSDRFNFVKKMDYICKK